MTRFTKFLRVLACVSTLLIISNTSAQSWPPYGIIMNGDGSPSAPWEITTYNELSALAAYVNAGNGSSTSGVYYKLMNDILYSQFGTPQGWSPIGDNIAVDAIFQGNFDGNDKIIFNFRSNRVSQGFIGLFGYILDANIHNLGIENCNFTGNRFVGGLVGQADNSTITNCFATGEVTGNWQVGGLIGSCDNTLENVTSISKSYSTCNVEGYTDVGGFIGTNYGTIYECYSEGIINQVQDQAGGFVGCNYKNILDCYATGNVSGSGSHIGGFAGASKEGIIDYCYANGNIAGTIPFADFIGGFTGISTAILQNCVAANDSVTGGFSHVNRIAGENGGIISNNYAYDEMEIITSGGPIENGIDATWIDLTSFNFYNTGSNWFNNIPWSIDNVQNPNKSWILCDDNMLPRLQWEGIDCDPILPDTCFFYAFGGDGTQGDPYQIYYPCQLADLATFVNSGNGAQTANKYFKLMNDIDLIAYSIGNGWEPIGFPNIPYGYFWFQGNFDGNGQVIKNLMINRSSDFLVGLFGSICNATIKNIGIEDCRIYGDACVGGLAGEMEGNSIITNCYSTGNVIGRKHAVGGLIGGIDNWLVPYSSSIEKCYSICDVSGTENHSGIGGLAGGVNGNNIISNSYATGNVGGYFSIGGLVGALSIGNNDIFFCYAKGDVRGSFGIGGIGGSCSEATLRNCVAANNSIAGGSSNINHIAGSVSGTNTFSNNYYNAGMGVIPGINGGVSGISQPMDTLMSFNFYNTGTNWFNNIPWDVDNVQNSSVIWGICDGRTLPFFQWQGFNCSKAMLSGDNSFTLKNEKSTFLIYPNPTSNIITIYSESDFHTIEIVDLFGRVLHSQINSENNITIDVSKFCSGIYFIRIISNNSASVQKFVKK